MTAILFDPNMATMSVHDEILAFGAEVAQQRIEMSQIFERAGLHRSTWRLWRDGRASPTLDNWRAVHRVFREIIAERGAVIPPAREQEQENV